MKISTASISESLDLIHKGDAIGYLEFPENFTHHFRNRAVHRNFADNETIDGSSLRMRMDLSGLSFLLLLESLLNYQVQLID